MKTEIKIFLASAAALALIPLLAGQSPLASEQILARVTVESNEVYVGEPFLMRITIIGSTEAERPDLSGLEGFDVKFQGEANNSSHSVSIINGKVTRNVKREYIYNYQLTPVRSGVLEIPSIPVKAEDRTLQSNSVRIRVKEPEETEDFKLRLRLSQNECYAGEPVLLTVTWYLRKDIRSFEFTAPFLETEKFEVEEPEVELDNRKQYFRVPVAGYEFIAEKGRDTLAAKSYATLSFSVAITPTEPGLFVIPEFIVACETGSSIRDRFFEDFFSEGFQSGRERSRKYVIPSNTPTLKVKSLPLEGRPEGFAGHIGRFRISAEAEPLEVNIGDPITLRVTLEGPEFLDNVTLPPISEMEGFAENFKIPEERAAGEVENGKKVFTQTIRPLSADAKEIPPVRIVSFDTGTGKYRTVQTGPIPLTVNPTRIVKASDAEGTSLNGQVSALESWKDGIAYNYEGSQVLARKDYGFSAAISRWWHILIISVPPAAFFIILISAALARKSKSDPMGKRSRRAFRELKRKLSAIKKSGSEGPEACAGILEAFKEYFACKLCRQTLSMTTDEIEHELRRRDIDKDTIEPLKGLIEICEAGTYAGETPGSGGNPQSITRELEKLIRRIEKKL
ncbi:MAG: BatD family protein [Candidatus Krumholzibacteriales bacterium]